MSTPQEIRAHLRAYQDPGVTGVAHVMLDDRRVGMLAYVADRLGWDVLALSPRGHYRSVTPPTISGQLEDWERCARSAFPIFAALLAAESRASPKPPSSPTRRPYAPTAPAPTTGATPGDPCTYEGPVLARGSRGYNVALVQRWLNIVRTSEAGRPTLAAELLDPNGHFSSRTTRRVREFQVSRGLVVDGRVGPQTWRALCCAASR